MKIGFGELSVILLGVILPLGFAVYLLSLLVRALQKYLRSPEHRPEPTTRVPETAARRRSLAEILKNRRIEKGMTQELVADALSVSRQTVSKWETGASDPSTGNLIALAKLYGTTAAELLKGLEEQ